MAQIETGFFEDETMSRMGREKAVLRPRSLVPNAQRGVKLKLAFAIISISGVHALKTYLSGDLTLDNILIVTMVAVIHFTFVLSAIGISYAERLTRDNN